MQTTPRKTTEELFDEGTEIDEALAQAAREARLRHKRLGHPIIVWEGGRVVEVLPGQIEVDPPVADAGSDAAPGGDGDGAP